MFTFRKVKLTAVLVATTALGACSMYTADTAREGIGYREARFTEISAMREYRACREEALEMDRSAKTSSSTARYIASAKLLDKCEAELGPEAAKVGQEERIRAVALSVQNYFKGGDVAKARRNLSKMKKAFPGQDLHFEIGRAHV